ncbi:F-box only protein 2-like [Chiloscyllium punctatum]|uniref:F-box only protein 2-like n=1 Tax=Chiloscyllium punctatum TaxID=137246 RepID=UPI003B63DF80
MEGILNVKTEFSLHKNCTVVTLTSTVIDMCIDSQQIGKGKSSRAHFQQPITRKAGHRHLKSFTTSSTEDACSLSTCFNAALHNRWCEKSQLINLISEGFEAGILDNIQPPITLRDWYAGRHDCGFEYEPHVELLSEDMSKIQEYKTDKIRGPQWNDAEWREVSNTFTNYGSGVRYVMFTHGGKDSKWWAGWYGARVTNSSVTIEQ